MDVVFLREQVEFFDGEIGMRCDEELHAAFGKFVEHPQEFDDGFGMQRGFNLVEEYDGSWRQVTVGQQLVEDRDFLDAFGCRIDGIERVALFVVPLMFLLVIINGAAKNVLENLAAVGEMLVVVAALAWQLQSFDQIEVGIVKTVHHVLFAGFQDDILE